MLYDVGMARILRPDMLENEVPPEAAWTLGQRIKHARKERNITQESLARHFGINKQAISNWERDENRPDQARLSALSSLLAVEVDWLLTGEGDGVYGRAPSDDLFGLGFHYIPVLSNIQAGHWTEAIENPDETLIPTDVPVSNSAFALTIRGSSMEPVFQDGDRVIIDPAVSPRPGDYVAAKRDVDQEATFKRYRVAEADGNGPKVIELVPLNPDWPALRIDKDHPGRIIGTMLEHRRYRSK